MIDGRPFIQRKQNVAEKYFRAKGFLNNYVTNYYGVIYILNSKFTTMLNIEMQLKTLILNCIS